MHFKSSSNKTSRIVEKVIPMPEKKLKEIPPPPQIVIPEFLDRIEEIHQLTSKNHLNMQILVRKEEPRRSFIDFPDFRRSWRWRRSEDFVSCHQERNRDNMMPCRIIFTLTVYINFSVMNGDIDGLVTHSNTTFRVLSLRVGEHGTSPRH